MQGQLSELAARVVQQAQKLGASMSEAYLLNSKELSIEVREQEVENLKLAEERGLGLRVFKDGQMGFAYTSDLRWEAIEQTIAEAMANSRQTTPDDGNCLPEPVKEYPALDTFDPQIRREAVEKKIELARAVEKIGRGMDPRIKITETAGYEDNEYEVAICNSLGLRANHSGAYCGLYLVLVSQEGEDNQTGFAIQYRLRFSELDPRKVGEEAAEKAVRMLGAKKISTATMPVIFDPYVTTSFVGVLSPALSAESVQKGKSFFAGKVGKKVGGAISIIDDGILENGISSFPFDGEGVPGRRKVLIENGTLNGYLYNTYTAKKDGVSSTGNGTRSSFATTPEVGTTNLFVKPGSTSPGDLMSGIKDGLYITEVMGMHTANPISGDFSLGAAGIRIKDGRLDYPVRGVAVAGNLSHLLEAVEGVADDLTFYGSKGAPSICIGKMAISGS
ncbi:MAG: TldD/PmbA family protein [Firmicutes bacterium]|nr:TldD/PmbA family protein [Bacillota bacterium]